MKKTRKQQKKNKNQQKTLPLLQKGKKSKLMEFMKTHYIKVLSILFTAIVTVLVTKACDRIFPDEPIVVEKVPDTINVVHVYEPSTDSILRSIKEHAEKSIEISVIDTNTKNNIKQFSDKGFNQLMKSASFPNAKGYSVRNSAPFFSLKMSGLKSPFVDFEYYFFSEDIISEVYCLSIKVCRRQDDQRTFVFEENYKMRKGRNAIRINNIFTSGKYEIEVGLFFKKDIDEQYPTFYREVKYINNP